MAANISLEDLMALQKENAELREQVKAAGDSKKAEIEKETLKAEIATTKTALDSALGEIKSLKESNLKTERESITAELKARNWSDDRIKGVLVGADSRTIAAIRETIKDFSKGQPGAPAVAMDSDDLPASPYLANMRKNGGKF